MSHKLIDGRECPACSGYGVEGEQRPSCQAASSNTTWHGEAGVPDSSEWTGGLASERAAAEEARERPSLAELRWLERPALVGLLAKNAGEIGYKLARLEVVARERPAQEAANLRADLMALVMDRGRIAAALGAHGVAGTAEADNELGAVAARRREVRAKLTGKG